MSLDMVWLVLMGLLLGGYFVLGGYDYGTQLLYPFVGRDENGRRAVRGALGPFFFGNEVWLVGFAGVLFGAFPFLEGTLFSGLYPLLVVLLLGLVLGKAAVQLRGRTAVRRGWDVLIVVGGVVPAACWGVVVGVLLNGVPFGTDGTFAIGWADVLDPFVVMAGVSNVLLLGAHGAAFLSIRTGGETAERAREAARPLLVAAIAATGVTTALGTGSAVTRPVTAFLLAAVLVAALLTALWSVTGGRSTRAFAATSVAALLPVPLVGAGLHPYVLVSTVDGVAGMTAAEGAADGSTLAALLPFGALLIPTIIGYQLWSWWLFRGRAGDRTPTYF